MMLESVLDYDNFNVLNQFYACSYPDTLPESTPKHYLAFVSRQHCIYGMFYDTLYHVKNICCSFFVINRSESCRTVNNLFPLRHCHCRVITLVMTLRCLIYVYLYDITVLSPVPCRAVI